MLRFRAVAAMVTVLAAACAGILALMAVPASADAVRDGQQWVLNMLDAPAAWTVSQGRGVTVAVLDSGVQPNVPDLAGSVVTGPNLTGISTPPSNPNWGQHGTWMASIIAGHGHGPGGSNGIIGLAPDAKILSVRVIPDKNDPGYNSYEHEQENRVQGSLAAGIRYAADHGAEVISMSIGYSVPSAAVRSALQDAYNHGIVVVASSGNSGGTTSALRHGYAPLSFPADYPGVIGVAAVDADGDAAGFSSDNFSVQVAAPGVNIPAQGRDGQYWLVSGTSPACALVAGVAALIKSSYPGLAPDLVAKALTSTTQYRPAAGYDKQVGFGTVDAAAALSAARRLSAQRAAQPEVTSAANFGGGPSAVPANPVRPRGTGQLVLFSVLTLTSLVLIAAAVTRLVVLGRVRRSEEDLLADWPAPAPGLPPHPGAVRPAPGLPPHPGAVRPAPGLPPHPGAVRPAPGPPPRPGIVRSAPNGAPPPDVGAVAPPGPGASRPARD
jgi:type VII secretion-associated serine protease mycosin